MLALWIVLFVVGALAVALKPSKANFDKKALTLKATPAESDAIKYPQYTFGKKCVVTGGAGFVGRHIVDVLIAQNHEVTIFDLAKTFDDPRLKFVQGNLVNAEEVTAALAGADVVFHVAAPHANNTNYKVQHAVNVIGTKNIIAACRANGIENLVFTSSASVIYTGVSQQAAKESDPYPKKFRDPYSQTKAAAEQLVIDAGRDDSPLRTACIRPHGIYGPRDPQLMPTLIAQTRAGRGKFVVGDGANVVDFTYVGNIVHGHMLAAEKLSAGADASQGVNGEVFHITNDEPIPFWDFIAMIQINMGYSPPKMKLPFRPLFLLASLVQFIMSLIPGLRGRQITFSPSRLQLIATHHYYDCGKAKRKLGYKPLWNTQQGLSCMLRSFPKLRAGADKETDGDVDTTTVYTVEEVAKHDNSDDAWLILDNKVYDVSDYVLRHPGGDAILNNVGRDASEGFHGPQHPSSVFETVKQFQIGVIASS